MLQVWNLIERKPLFTGLYGFGMTTGSTVAGWLELIAGIAQPIGIIAGATLTVLSLIVYIRKHFTNQEQ